MNMKKFLLGLAIFSQLGFAQTTILRPNKLQIGRSSSDKEIIFDKGSGSANPRIKWNNSTSKLTFANDGTTFTNLDKVPSVAAKTANYTVLSTDGILKGDTTSGAFTFTMPAASGVTGQSFTFDKVSSDTNLITISNGSNTFDGASSYTVRNLNDKVTIYSDGTQYRVVNKSSGKRIYSAEISSSDVVSGEDDADWINGNCTDATTGHFSCTFTAGTFSATPKCWGQTSTNNVSQPVRLSISSSAVSMIQYDSTGTGVNVATTLFCEGR